jgi:hypothetical protein
LARHTLAPAHAALTATCCVRPGCRWDKYKQIRAGIDANEGSLEKFSRGAPPCALRRARLGLAPRLAAPCADPSR